MTALYVLIPVAVVIVAICIWIFFWAVGNGQYDDLDSPAHSILFDDDEKTLAPSQRQAPSHVEGNEHDEEPRQRD